MVEFFQPQAVGPWFLKGRVSFHFLIGVIKQIFPGDGAIIESRLCTLHVYYRCDKGIALACEYAEAYTPPRAGNLHCLSRDALYTMLWRIPRITQRTKIMDQDIRTQVVVVGAGNAGLSAAVAARQGGADVIVLEKAPKQYRGGNSALTVHMLFAYDGVEDLKPLLADLSPETLKRMNERIYGYTKERYYDNIMNVTEGMSDPELASILVNQSYETVQWMRGLGHLWALTFDNPISANAVSFDGGGYGMSNRWFAAFEKLGGTVHYDTQAVDLFQDDQGKVTGVRALGPNGFVNVHANVVIMAAGSFESNAEMRARYLGPLWDTVKLRGTPFNTGEGLQMAMNIGALPNGSWSSCHSSPQDANRPAFDYPGENKTGDFWSRYSYPYSVMVNLNGKRFVDEGETWRGLTYAKMGRAILAQPRGQAFQIFDS